MADLAIEDRLNILRFQTQERMANGGHAAPPRKASTPRGDQIERASVHTDTRVKDAVIKSLAMVLDRVERALEKLGEGTYGRCDLCGHPIPESRLKACPEATEHVVRSWPAGSKPGGLGEDVMACSDYGVPQIKKPWFALRR